MADSNLFVQFQAQFTEGDNGWSFRARRFGPAIPLTASEKDLFITGFQRAEEWRRNASCNLILVTMLPLLALKLMRPELIGEYFNAWALGICTLLAWFVAIHDSMAVHVPALALSNRASVARAIEPAEVGYGPSRTFGIMIWLQPVCLLILLVAQLDQTSRNHRSDVEWLCVTACAGLTALVFYNRCTAFMAMFLDKPGTAQ